jgi:hypothetical protein
MTRSLSVLALPIALSACAMQTYDFEEKSAIAPPPDAIYGIALPDSAPIREPFTRCHQVKGDKGVVGYLVVYEAAPRSALHGERKYPEGTILVEDARFDLIGVVTAHGHATRYTRGKSEAIGRGTIDELLPRFFGQQGLTRTPISS